MALCTVAGIGGGGVATAMLMAMFYFTTKNAIAISVSSILVCSTSRYLFNLNTPHPEKPNVNLLDYGLASIMMPLTLAGAQFGGIVLDIFPESAIQIMLFCLLLFLTWSTTQKALKLHRKEVADKQKTSKVIDDKSGVEMVTNSNGNGPGEATADGEKKEGNTERSLGAATPAAEEKLLDGVANKDNDDDNKSVHSEEIEAGGDTKIVKVAPAAASQSQKGFKRTKTYTDFDEQGQMIIKEGTPDDASQSIKVSDQTFVLGRSVKSDKEVLRLSKIAKTESSPFQCAKISLCLLMIGFVIAMNFLQPTDSYDSPLGIKKCDAGYFGIICLFVLLCVGVTVFAVHLNRKEQDLKIKYSVNYKEGDILYKGKNLVTLVAIGFFGGFIAGALGLGGGSIYNPAFLAMGVHPKSSGSTGMFLVMISTINSVAIVYVNGYLEFYFACWISLYALIGSLIGMASTDWVVKKTGKPSILVWLLVFVFLISTISTPIFGYIQISESASKGRDVWAFRDFCAAE